MLRKYRSKFEDKMRVDAMFECGRCLERYVDLLRASPPRVPEIVVAQLLELWQRHTQLYQNLGFDPLPKHHLMVHATVRQVASGNLWLHSCFGDESINKLLKRACKAALQSNFENTVLTKMEDMLKRYHAKRKSDW